MHKTVESLLIGKENQLDLLKQELAHLTGGGVEQTLGFFKVEKDKEEEKDEYYLKNKRFAVIRVKEAIILREIAKGNFSAGCIYVYPRNWRLHQKKGKESSAVLKTDYSQKKNRISITSKRGWIERNDVFLTSLSAIIQKAVMEINLDDKLIPLTLDGVQLDFQFTAER
ncbi:hypothetical protein KAU11_10635 [Candidatus Babeliales bacterium]|nr:hypothetical protein [Candidatus Babeliales bacterium]